MISAKAVVNADTLSPDGIQARFEELQDFIAGQETDITKFDEALVKKLIEKIAVFADHFTVEFESGIRIDIKAKTRLTYYLHPLSISINSLKLICIHTGNYKNILRGCRTNV